MGVTGAVPSRSACILQSRVSSLSDSALEVQIIKLPSTQSGYEVSYEYTREEQAARRGIIHIVKEITTCYTQTCSKPAENFALSLTGETGYVPLPGI